SGGSVGAAELTIGLLLTLWRQIATYDQLLHHGGWTTPYGRVLQGKTIGLLGLGRVGSHVSRLAHAFGMQVLAWSPHLDAARARQVGAEATDLESLLRRSDVVSVHLTLSDSTRDLLDGKRLDLMPRGALLINTARGPIVNEQALVARLRSGHLGGAGLDVFDQEPLPPDHPLRHLPNVVLTPHAGWPTDAAYISFAETAVQLVEEFLAKDPSHLVNPQALETGRQGR
ncbi:MAG: D-2-hydroxyacid dehydrogenase family protein, partial [Firmicutes bacterium]|nr:D-2-hydroxyacid dehydrogenase family protein [Bacillota bacterium]